jgi:hypothetical protein
VIVSETNDSTMKAVAKSYANAKNETQTITLFGLSSNASNPALEKFHSLTTLTDGWTAYYLKYNSDRPSAQAQAEDKNYPQLEVLVEYPKLEPYSTGGLFDEKGELSALVLLDGSQDVCGGPGSFVTLSDVMLAGEKDSEKYRAPILPHDQGKFIDLNRYLLINRLQGLADDPKSDPRGGVHDLFAELRIALGQMPGFKPIAGSEMGVARVLAVGASQ